MDMHNPDPDALGIPLNILFHAPRDPLRHAHAPVRAEQAANTDRHIAALHVRDSLAVPLRVGPRLAPNGQDVVDGESDRSPRSLVAHHVVLDDGRDARVGAADVFGRRREVVRRNGVDVLGSRGQVSR